MKNQTSLGFYGATNTVTGSKYLLRSGGSKVLVDCGLFQGYKQLRLRNWQAPPIDPASLDAIVLTHAHIDHSGYLPRMVQQGYRGPVYCTGGTAELCALLLPDSGRLQEHDAEYAARRGFSRHRPAQPLYTEKDARIAVESLQPCAWGEDVALADGVTARFHPAGHIIGASSVMVRTEHTSVLFSGDLGRLDDIMMRPPAPREASDVLVIESTYGNRKHDTKPADQALAEVIARTAARGGIVVIPAFAVGRTQAVLLLVDRLKAARRIPDIPVFLDSPMAISATSIFYRQRHNHRLDQAECERMCEGSRYVRDVAGSKALDERKGPMILISASGMATGGRVVHHLKKMAPDPANTILFAGFQAGGTRGAAMLGGAKEIKIHGGYVPVNAEVVSLDMLSAHADADEIIAWLRTCEEAPRRTFVTHGEPTAADALRRRIQDELGWTVSVPSYSDVVKLHR